MRSQASIAQDSSPTVIAAYCYAIYYQPTDTWSYVARWPKPIKVANMPAFLGGTGATIAFQPGQVAHNEVVQTQGFEAKSVGLVAKVFGDLMARFFITPSTVRVKVFILRVATADLLEHDATLDFDTDVQICESGVIGNVGLNGTNVESDLIPEPFIGSQAVPRIAFGRTCQRVFGQCGVDLEAIKTLTTIYEADRATRTLTLAVAMPSVNYWRSGNLVHPETGVRLYIETADNTGTGGRAKIRLSAWVKEFTAGDNVTVYPGCVLTTDACRVHSNIANYGGFPYVPESNPSIRGAS
jgi:hypothetical protein